MGKEPQEACHDGGMGVNHAVCLPKLRPDARR